MVDTISINDENDPDDVGEYKSYRMVNVQHNGPWTIYTDSGFEKAISQIVGFEVGFTEQGMQDDGMASMEGNIEESVQEGVMEGFSPATGSIKTSYIQLPENTKLIIKHTKSVNEEVRGSRLT